MCKARIHNNIAQHKYDTISAQNTGSFVLSENWLIGSTDKYGYIHIHTESYVLDDYSLQTRSQWARTHRSIYLQRATLLIWNFSVYMCSSYYICIHYISISMNTRPFFHTEYTARISYVQLRAYYFHSSCVSENFQKFIYQLFVMQKKGDGFKK